MTWRDRIDSATLKRSLWGMTERAVNAIGAGISHRRRLASIDTRIVVSGVRGKSTTTEWLHDIFHRRGNDTYAKVTGNEPVSLYNGETHDIDRPDQVRLYENEKELRKFGPVDVAIFENQGIRQYTTRLVNESFVKPDIIFIVNLREDHLDTLGYDREEITRSLARAVPSGTHVINGEADPRLRSYLTAELQRRSATVTHVDVPPSAREIPGAEIVYGIQEILDALDEPRCSEDWVDRKLSSLVPEWRSVPSGRIYNAAEVNDVQSTELVRRALLGETEERIEPILFLRADRRGRTASFYRYHRWLTETGRSERVHVTGGGREAFATKADFEVRTYDEATISPDDLLDEAFAAGHPVLVMGNTVDEFMRELEEAIDQRTRNADGE